MHARPGKEYYLNTPIQGIEKVKADLPFSKTDLESARNRLMGLEGAAGRSYSSVYMACFLKNINSMGDLEDRQKTHSMHVSITVMEYYSLLLKRPVSYLASTRMSDSYTRIITTKSLWCSISLSLC